MDWITPEIAIGNFQDAADSEALRREGIRSLLCLDRAHAKLNARQLGVKAVEVVHLDDGPGNDRRTLNRAIEALSSLTKESPPVLVHCHAGRSRSVIVVAGHLTRADGLTVQDALCRVQEKREGRISPGLIASLERWADNAEGPG